MKNITTTTATTATTTTTATSATTTTKNPRRYYALHWKCGRGATSANTGGDFVTVYGFDSKTERDAACENFRAPNHRPQAALEPIPASNRNVRAGDVLEWI